MNKTTALKVGNKAMNGVFSELKPVKSSQTLRAKKTIDQQIKEDIKRNIGVYIRLRDR